MFISSKNAGTPVFDTDYILSGFTFRDLINTANANGEDVAVTLDNMIKETITNAREYFYTNKYALNVIQRFDKSTHEWIKTDDLQWCRWFSPFKFELIQAVENDDKFFICASQTVDLEDYINITPYGFTYKEKTAQIVRSYYKSTEDFNELYNEFDILQILAELIYETHAEFQKHIPPMTAERAERFIKKHYL